MELKNLKANFVGKKFYFEKEISSTNIFLNELSSKENLLEGTVVLTDFQSGGKGYSGNKWESEDGKNLLLSVFLKPTFLKPTRQFFLNQAVCVAVAKAINEFANVDCKIKWPNDIYVGDKKLGGILIENSIQGESILQSVIGIGINVNQENFSVSLPNPVSLFQLKKISFDLNIFTEKLLENLEAEYLRLKENKIAALQVEYMSKLYRNDEEHVYFFRNEKLLPGVHWAKAKIAGLNPEGKLLLRLKDNFVACGFKEVEYVI